MISLFDYYNLRKNFLKWCMILVQYIYYSLYLIEDLDLGYYKTIYVECIWANKFFFTSQQIDKYQYQEYSNIFTLV